MPNHGNYQDTSKAKYETQVIDVLQALQELQQQVRQEMDQAGKQVAKVEIQAKQPNMIGENWWTLKEYTFPSTTPVIGPLITMFRKSWSQVASRWLALDLINQQNWVNQQLSERISAQAEVLGDMDRELIRLTRQVAELSYHSYRSME